MGTVPNKTAATKITPVTDEEAVFVAKAMDHNEDLNWDSPDHNHVVARENAKGSAKRAIRAHRACIKLDSLGTSSKTPEYADFTDAQRRVAMTDAQRKDFDANPERRAAINADMDRVLADQNRLNPAGTFKNVDVNTVAADKARIVGDQNRLAADQTPPSFPPNIIPTTPPYKPAV